MECTVPAARKASGHIKGRARPHCPSGIKGPRGSLNDDIIMMSWVVT